MRTIHGGHLRTVRGTDYGPEHRGPIYLPTYLYTALTRETAHKLKSVVCRQWQWQWPMPVATVMPILLASEVKRGHVFLSGSGSVSGVDLVRLFSYPCPSVEGHSGVRIRIRSRTKANEPERTRTNQGLATDHGHGHQHVQQLIKAKYIGICPRNYSPPPPHGTAGQEQAHRWMDMGFADAISLGSWPWSGLGLVWSIWHDSDPDCHELGYRQELSTSEVPFSARFGR
ncbi:uncharacterized protein ASPGLDRAFT_30089 [Aspergillus glaucus CBS 516.65]|uniref:Uncharacterized protein n=1 Tax=Aspergillus glaucus CBS 516.65 TaxID=1160497 RepID=A0A1L9V5I6_ASPGL|nr:hypothetical protein ASPGLDRAFT_30089 [Aspergillus glaucus CBS 516.65]OJJ79185.1 hypothetical protein ASPGLDRAFT_30089 [Aspergillus glaucus CBS 516.65]